MIDGLADGSVIDDFRFGDGSGSERGDADLVNLSGDTLGPFGDALESIVGEKGMMIMDAGDLEMMLDVGEGRLKIERLDMSAVRDTLGKGGMGGELQHTFEFGLTDEDESGQRLAVELSRN